MRKCRTCYVVVMAASLAAVWPARARAADSEPNAADLVRAVRRGEMWMHDCDSLHIRVLSRWTKTPEGIARRRAEIKEEYGIDDPNVTRFPGLRAASEQSLEFAVDDTRVRYFADDPGYWRQVKVWDGNELRIHEKYYHHPQEQYILYREIPNRMFHELFPCYYGWPRSQAHSFWYDRRDVNDTLEFYGPPEGFRLVGQEVYRERPCYVLECQVPAPRATDLTWRWFVGRSDGLLYGVQAVRAGRPGTEHWWSDYRQIAPGGWFPMKSGWCFYDFDEAGQAHVNSTCNQEVIEFHLNESLSQELFVLPIEPGVEVADWRSGQVRIYKQWPSLLGKKAEAFTDIGLPAPPAQGKPLLIAFVDLEQRPSRHALQELVVRLDTSLHGRVEAVVIQASKMPAETLATWRQKLNVPLPIGVVTGDADAVRWAWGAESLPWLILTDRNRVVAAAGVSLDELDEAIKD